MYMYEWIRMDIVVHVAYLCVTFFFIHANKLLLWGHVNSSVAQVLALRKWEETQALPIICDACYVS